MLLRQLDNIMLHVSQVKLVALVVKPQQCPKQTHVVHEDPEFCTSDWKFQPVNDSGLAYAQDVCRPLKPRHNGFNNLQHVSSDNGING